MTVDTTTPAVTVHNLDDVVNLLRSMNTKLGMMERIMARNEAEIAGDWDPEDDEVQDAATEVLLAKAIKKVK